MNSSNVKTSKNKFESTYCRSIQLFDKSTEKGIERIVDNCQMSNDEYGQDYDKKSNVPSRTGNVSQKRFIYFEEPSSDFHLNTNNLMEYTGGCHYHYRTIFTFQMQRKLLCDKAHCKSIKGG